MTCAYCKRGDHHLCSSSGRRSGSLNVPPICECAHTVADVAASNMKRHGEAPR